jgi:hypothetical protein
MHLYMAINFGRVFHQTIYSFILGLDYRFRKDVIFLVKIKLLLFDSHLLNLLMIKSNFYIKFISFLLFFGTTQTMQVPII